MPSWSELTDRQFQVELERLEREAEVRIREHTSDLPDSSPAAKEARRARGARDRAWFYRHYFPHLFDEPEGPEWETWEAVRAAHSLVLLSAHREWGKSTKETYAETIRELVIGESDFTVLSGDTEKDTVPMVLQARMEFDHNERLRQDYGELERGAIWRQDQFILRNGREVRGLSIESGLRGQRSVVKNVRPDRWKLDDFQTDKRVRNPDHVTELVGTIRAKIIPAMNRRRDSKVIAVGHPLTHDCAVMRLKEDGAWGTFWHAAVKDLTTLEPTNAERFTREFLAEKRAQLGSIIFNREYGLTAVKQDALVRPEWWRYYRPEQIAGLPLVCAIYWDPAIKKGGGGDFKAIIAKGLHVQTGNEYCLGAFIRKEASPREQCLAFWRLAERVRKMPGCVLALGYESNAFQVLLEYPLDQARAEMDLPELGVQPIVNTAPKDVRVAALAPKFERGVMHYVAGDADQERLRQQWLYWPDMGMDGPDAERGCEDLMLQLSRRGRSQAQSIPSVAAQQPGVW